MPDSQNFNTVSGISTFNNLDIANNLSVGASITSGSMAYFGGEVGIGTTNSVGFLTGPTNLIGHAEGSLWAQTGYYTAGKIIVTNKVDGSSYLDERIIPGDLGSVIPSVDYGGFQIKQPAATFFTSNFTIVPSVGVATVGFGSTNGALIPSSFQEGGNRYLTNIGINTYYARSILDVGTASTTMNSYFIPPSLTQAEIDIMATLPGTPTATGHAGSKLVTPDGIVPGAIIYNKTTDQIQVGASTNTFRNINSQYSDTQTITSGDTEVVFNDVPTWANKITILFLNISHTHTPGNKHFRVQLGTSSSFITSNYDSKSENYSSYADIVDGFVIFGKTNAATFSGQQTITKFDDATYVETHILSSFTEGISHGGGNLESISDTITRLRINMQDGSTTFSGGKIKVLYEA
tara:strand:- start:244 stop:1461 length:1218 start_codon:yes stop_codon:yes gene_type:complete